MASLRPGIACVSICAYAHDGPWAARRGFDSIVQNVTGLAATQSSLARPRNMPVQAHWLAGLGTVDATQGAAELPDARLAALLMESDGPFGHVRHLEPVVQLSETPAFYACPAEPLGTSAARWI